MIADKIKKLTKTEKGIAFLILIQLLWLPLGFFHKGSILFLAMASITAIYFLYHFIFSIFRHLDIQLDTSDWVIMALCALFSSIPLFTSILTRDVAFNFDSNHYYCVLDSLKSACIDRGSFGAIENFFVTVYADDYTNFIVYFLAIFMFFTSWSQAAFNACFAFGLLPPIILSLTLLVKILGKRLPEGRSKILLFCALIACLFSPSGFLNYYIAMPDVFGITFCFLIIALTITTDFTQKDRKRELYLFLATMALFLTRRWYAFWIVSYYIPYGIIILIKSFRDKENRGSACRNFILFGLKSALAGGLFLSPVVYHVIVFNYGSSYASYLSDGLFANFVTYIHNIGPLFFTLSLAGGILSFCYLPRLRMVAGLSLVCFFLPLILFHRIQSADFHQLLILFPSYSVLLALLMLWILSLKMERLPLLYMEIFSLLIVVNYVLAFVPSAYNKAHAWPNSRTDGSYTFPSPYTNDFTPIKTPFARKWIFSSVPLRMAERNDKKELMDLATWITENCDNYELYDTSDNKLYMIPHGSNYSPSLFRALLYPNHILHDLLPYGSDILSSQPFPLDYLTADYVLDLTPIDATGIGIILHEAMPELVAKGIFKQDRDFDMHNGFVFTLYRRQVPLSLEEIDYYRTITKAQSEQYPHLYIPVFEEAEEMVREGM